MSEKDISITTPQVSLSVEYQLIEVCLDAVTVLAADVGPHTTLLTSDPTQMCVEAFEASEVIIAPTHAISTIVGAQGPAGMAGTGLEAVYLPNFDTSLVFSGRMVYSSNNFLVEHTDAASWPQAHALGAFDGQWGRILAFGIASMVFTAASPTPTVGSLVFLARADSETGAAGKLTASAPAAGTGTFASPVGYVVSVPGSFSTSRTAHVHIRVQTSTHRAS